MKKIYLDYAATTPVDPAVLKAMQPYFSKKFGNPGSLHSFGQEASAVLDQSREVIAKSIGADFREIIFTSGATEANNLALRGAIEALKICFQKTPSISPARKSRLGRLASLSSLRSEPCPLGLRDTFSNKFLAPKIIVSPVEHESILEVARDLEKKAVEVLYVRVDKNGLVDLWQLEKELDERTILVSVMYANNEIGVVEPIEEIAKIIKEFREENNSIYPLFHTDATQAFQYIDIKPKEIGIDLMTVSSHKIYGPKGVGALYIDKKITKNFKLAPVLTGGGQEFGLRSGTENVAAIVGFAKAIELVSSLRLRRGLPDSVVQAGFGRQARELEDKRIRGLRDYFWREIKKVYPKAELNGPALTSNRLPNNLNIYFPRKSAEDLLIKFDMAGIAVSAGSACSARSSKPSYVLEACGFPAERIKSSLRITLGRPTTEAEIDEAIRRIKTIVKN